MSVHKHENCNGCEGLCCLELQNVGVSVGDAELLHDVGFHLHCGEIAALIGPNGAGKSSLFKAILGQLPHSGSIRFQRSDGKKSRPVIGYVPQSPAFDRSDPVSVLDLFIAAAQDWPVFLPIPQKLRDRAVECLARTHAEGLLDKRLGALSGGELQRVLMALALELLQQSRHALHRQQRAAIPPAAHQRRDIAPQTLGQAGLHGGNGLILLDGAPVHANPLHGAEHLPQQQRAVLLRHVQAPDIALGTVVNQDVAHIEDDLSDHRVSSLPAARRDGGRL